jgi:hypothetical protein
MLVHHLAYNGGVAAGERSLREIRSPRKYTRSDMAWPWGHSNRWPDYTVWIPAIVEARKLLTLMSAMFRGHSPLPPECAEYAGADEANHDIGAEGD